MLTIGRRTQREDGQSIVTVALMSMFLLAILAVVADTGFVWMQRRNLQNAADAAALAGAQELPGTDAAAIAAAESYAAKNVSNLASTTVTFPERLPDPDLRATAVRVVVHKNSASLFGVSLGFGEKDISAKATARIASFNIIRCVVPLAVQDTAYFTATAEPIPEPPPIVELKTGLHEGTAGSNTGLVNLGPGNSADPIRTGGGCDLGPTIPTKPGLTGGDVRNGFQDRLEAAQANSCYTWEAARPPTDGTPWRCKPEASVASGCVSDCIERTAVVLLPVLSVDISNSGTGSYPLTKLSNGQFLLAYFWIAGDLTWNTSLNTWQCLDNPDCIIRGRFIVDQPVDLSVFDPSQCPPGPQGCVIDFDPAATTKIVQLVE